MSAAYVIATARIRPERREAFLAAAKACVEETRREAGCLRYDMHESVSEPNCFVFVEEWTSKEAIDAHFERPHTIAFLRIAAVSVVAAPVIEIVTPAKVDRR